MIRKIDEKRLWFGGKNTDDTVCEECGKITEFIYYRDAVDEPKTDKIVCQTCFDTKYMKTAKVVDGY